MQVSLIKRIIEKSLQEDIGKGDITTESLISPGIQRKGARIVAKSEGVLCGVDIAKIVFCLLDKQTVFEDGSQDGDPFSPGEILLNMEADPSALLQGERVALNFLQRLSGIATLTRKFVEKSSPYGVRILDTRKTTPGLRLMEKYAVRTGGGINHRSSLDSGILIKDNHIKIAGGIKNAISRIRKNIPPLLKIEVEVSNLDELQEAVESEAEMIMLDNLGYQQLRKAIEFVRKNSKGTIIEVSGGVNLDNIEDIASLRPDFISVGRLTYLAANVDMSLEII